MDAEYVVTQTKLMELPGDTGVGTPERATLIAQFRNGAEADYNRITPSSIKVLTRECKAISTLAYNRIY